MKKISLILFFCISYSFAQNYFETGNIGIKMDNFGAVSVFSPLMYTKQIDRISILVAKDSLNVFDYLDDAGSVSTPQRTVPPEFGQFQLTSVINNSYSNNPPNIEVTLKSFGWDYSHFALVLFQITSKESIPFNSYIGLEILPVVDNSFGNEKVNLDFEKSIITISKKKNIGIRFLSNRIKGHRVIEWSSGYSSDLMYFKALSDSNLQKEYSAGKDGSVIFTSIGNINLQPNVPDSLWIAIAAADTLVDLIKNLDSASAKIPSILTSINKLVEINSYELFQNYPNPFNPFTKIDFQIPESGFVSLKVYDILGREVKEVVNEFLSDGHYTRSFDGNSLASGIYFYKLQVNKYVQIKKMVLLK